MNGIKARDSALLSSRIVMSSKASGGRTRQSTVVKIESQGETVPTEGNANVYVVDKIVDERTRRGKTEYFVKWQNFEDSDNTWESSNNIIDRKLIKEFHDRKAIAATEAGPNLKRKASESAAAIQERTTPTPSREKKNKPVVAEAASSPKKSKKKKSAAAATPTKPRREIYQVEDVCGVRRFAGRVEYFVKWKNYPEDENTWEPADHIPNKKLLKKYVIVDAETK